MRYGCHVKTTRIYVYRVQTYIKTVMIKLYSNDDSRDNKYYIRQ